VALSMRRFAAPFKRVGLGGEFAQDNAPASLRTYAASQKNQSHPNLLANCGERCEKFNS
jgi:hypothetical protein